MNKLITSFKVGKSRQILSATIILCVALSSCGHSPEIPVSNNYSTMKVALENTVLSERYAVSVRGKQNVEIRPQVSGQIMEICIDEGALIRKGQTLFIIDQVPYLSALETAKANVKSAEAKVATAQLTADSKQELYNQHIVSDFDLQTARNTLLEAQAGLGQAMAAKMNASNNLSYTVIKSPVDGVASMIPYKVGTLVSSSITTPLTTVSNDDEMYVYFSMAEKQVLDMIQTYGSLEKMIQAMPEIKLILNNGTEYKEHGKIDAVSGTVDAKTGSISIRASFPNPDKLLMNGASATILIPHEKKGCIIIPQSATFEVQNKRFVYKVVDGKAQSAIIQTSAIHDGKDFIVESGLQVGDIIISEGAGLVREGAPVDMNQK